MSQSSTVCVNMVQEKTAQVLLFEFIGRWRGNTRLNRPNQLQNNVCDAVDDGNGGAVDTPMPGWWYMQWCHDKLDDNNVNSDDDDWDDNVLDDNDDPIEKNESICKGKLMLSNQRL